MALKVFDWTDREPFVAYLLIVYMGQIVGSGDEKAQKLLSEVQKRLLNIDSQQLSASNLSQPLPFAQACLLCCENLPTKQSVLLGPLMRKKLQTVIPQATEHPLELCYLIRGLNILRMNEGTQQTLRQL
jgi:hypothetical protein